MSLTEVNSLGIKDLEVKTADIAAANVTLAKVENVTDGQIIVGNGSNRPTAVAVSGDVTLANTGAVTIANGAVEHAMLADDSVDGDNIADNSVGLAAMAHGTDGNLITYNASGEPAHVATGNDGQVLTSQGAGQPPQFETISTTDTKSFRNLIINGACLIAQRGTSSTSHGYATVDRLKTYETGTDCGTKTYTQSDVGAGDAYDAGFRKCFKVTTSQAGNTSTATDSFKFWATRLEAQDIACSGWDYTDPNSKLALSFWIKASTADTFVVQLQTSDGTAKKYNIPVPATTSWTKITKIIPGHADLSFDTNTDQGLAISLFIATGSDLAGTVTQESWVANATAAMSASVINTWIAAGAGSVETTGWQLEVGSAATDFEHRSYADELARCERYYQVIGDIDNDPLCNIYGESAIIQGVHHFRTEMRAVPSVHSSNSTDHFKARIGVGNHLFDTCTFNDCSKQAVIVYGNLGSGTYTNYAGILRLNHNDAYLSAQAEL